MQVFVIVSGLGFVYMCFTIPETKGIPLEEVAKIFGDDGEVEVFAQDVHIDDKTHEVAVTSHDEGVGQLKGTSYPVDMEVGTGLSDTILRA